MKKILLATAALGLGLGLAAGVAQAEMSFSSTGIYQAQGFWLNEGSDSKNGMQVGLFDKNLRFQDNGSSTTCSDGNLWQIGNKNYCQSGYKSDNNDMWHHLFYIYPKLQVNDNIAMKGEIRMIDRDIWGSNQATGPVNTPDYQDMDLRLAWMEYNSPIGLWSVGRILGGGWGSKFLDSTGNRDRIKYSPNIMPENWGMTLIYQKSVEKDAFDGGTDSADGASYYAGFNYNADFGRTDVAVWHSRYDSDYSTKPLNDGKFHNTELWINAAYSFGAINLLSEFNWAFEGEDELGADVKSMGLMVDVNTQMGDFTLGGLGFWLQGDTDPDDDNKGYIGRNGVGNDYNPFAIATGDYMGLLNGDKNGYLGAISAILGIPGYAPTDPDIMGGGQFNPGARALAGYAKYQFSEKLSFNGALGYIWADDAPSKVDDKMGWEADLGLSYKLLDNLTYSATVAYMAPSDMFDDLANGVENAYNAETGRNVSVNTNDIWLLLHNITMTF